MGIGKKEKGICHKKGRRGRCDEGKKKWNI